MNDQPQAYYESGVGYCTIYSDVVDKPDLVVVAQNSSLYVVRKDDLKKEEDTWEFQEARRRKDKIEKITEQAQANLDGIADKVVDRALIALASRMKFNAFFGKGDSGDAAWTVTIIKELEGLVKDKAANVVAGKKDSIF